MVEDQLDTVAEQREGPNTVIVGTFPIFDAKDYDEDRHDNHNDNNRSDNASPSVESYQSDEEESGASKEKKEEGGEEGDEGSAVDDEGRAKKGSAIRVSASNYVVCFYRACYAIMTFSWTTRRTANLHLILLTKLS